MISNLIYFCALKINDENQNNIILKIKMETQLSISNKS